MSRRFAIVLVLVAAAALVGCGRAQPGTAAYVGDTRFTERQVDRIADEVARSAEETRPTRVRESIVSRLVLCDLANRIAAEKKLTVPPADYDGAARAYRLPTTSRWVRLNAELGAAAIAISRSVDPVPPTDRDLRDIYDRIKAVQPVDGQPPQTAEELADEYAEFADSLSTNASLPPLLGVRNALQAKADQVGVDVNPLYQPLQTNLGDSEVPIVITIGRPNVTVTDLPRT